MNTKPTPKITPNSATLRILGVFAAIAFAVPIAHAQIIVSEPGATWYSSGAYSSNVGYSQYGYYTVPTSWKDAGFDGLQTNVVGDLLPQNVALGQNYENLLGDPAQNTVSGGTNPNAQNMFSVIWAAGDISTSAETDLVVFDLNGLSSVSSLTLYAFFHNNLYNIPSMDIYMNTQNSLATPNWVSIGSYSGLAYDSSGNKTANISLNTAVNGHYLMISATNDVEETAKAFNLGGVQMATTAVPEPNVFLLTIVGIGVAAFRRKCLT